MQNLECNRVWERINDHNRSGQIGMLELLENFQTNDIHIGSMEFSEAMTPKEKGLRHGGSVEGCSRRRGETGRCKRRGGRRGKRDNADNGGRSPKGGETKKLCAWCAHPSRKWQVTWNHDEHVCIYKRTTVALKLKRTHFAPLRNESTECGLRRAIIVVVERVASTTRLKFVRWSPLCWPTRSRIIGRRSGGLRSTLSLQRDGRAIAHHMWTWTQPLIAAVEVNEPAFRLAFRRVSPQLLAFPSPPKVQASSPSAGCQMSWLFGRLMASCCPLL